MPVYLRDLKRAHERCLRGTGNPVELFLEEQFIAELSWPESVVKQWLWDHGETEHFIPDYGNLDLGRVEWECERVPTVLLETVPTGASDHGSIEDYAKFPVYWAEKKG